MVSRKLFQALIDTSSAHFKRSRIEFQNLDLSPGQPKVLSYLFDNEGCPQKELAEKCNVEPATMTVLLRNMAAKELIRKESVRTPGGKRAYGIYLTEHGIKTAEVVKRVMESLEIVSFTGFTDEDKDRLIELLQKVSANLKNIESTPKSTPDTQKV